MRRIASLVGIALCLEGGGCGSGGGGGGGPPAPPPADSIVVQTPNGGERWAIGVQGYVTWAVSAGPALVDIDLSLDGGSSWSALVVGTPNDGSEAVIVPDAATATARVRVGAADGDPTTPTAPFDASDGDFEIGALFADVGAGLLGLDTGDVEWADFDGDGDLDLSLCGFDGLNPQTRVYRNDAGAFVDTAASVTGRAQSDMAWGDDDGDGDLDLLVNGYENGFVPATRRYENFQGTLVPTASLIASINGRFGFGDYDGDGDLDVALLGTAPNSATTSLQRNAGGASYSDAGAGLSGYEFGALAWGDYDADGDLDLAIAGQNVPWHTTRVYRNDGGAFVDVGASMIGWTDARLAWGDADGDGDLDLAVGCFVPDATPIIQTRIYLRTAGDTFVDSGAVLEVGGGGHLAWGDVDGDGDLDLAATGFGDGGAAVCRIFVNAGGGTFLPVASGLPAIGGGSLSWGDFDRDGDLDLAIMGYGPGPGRVTQILENLGTAPPPVLGNERPTAPDALEALPYSGGVVLLWEASTDLETPSSGLSYSVRIEALPSFAEVAPGMALDDGTRLVAALGAFRPHDPFSVAGFALPSGAYRASVQAIDASYAGGPFASVVFVVP
jgi:hypothetical protein